MFNMAANSPLGEGGIARVSNFVIFVDVMVYDVRRLKC